MIQILMMALSIYFLYLVLNNIEKAFWIALFLILSIPFSRYNNIMSYIDVVSIGGFSLTIIHFMILCLFIKTIICNKSIKIKKSFFLILIFLLFITYILGIIIGIANGYEAIADGQKFILQILWMIILVYNIKFLDINKLLKVTSKALSINFIIIIIMNIFQQKLSFMLLPEFYESGKGVIDSYASNLAIFPIIFCLYDFICKRNINYNRSIYFSAIISLIYTLFFQNSRSIILVVIIAATIICFFSLKNSNRKTFSSKLIIIALLLLLLLIIGGVYLQGNSDLVSRLINMDIFSKEDTLITRLNTIRYYYEEVKNNIFGYGFGRLIPLVNQYGRFHGIGSFYTDNAFVNIAMKCGIFSLIIYIVILIKPIKIQFKNYSRSKNIESIVLITTLSGFIFLTTILTSQLNHNYIIMVGGWAYIVAICRIDY